MELGAEALLMDEDNCATNLMHRDAKMMKLVAPGQEPITPFIRTVRKIYQQLRISTILVIGGTGDYFDVADYVLMMDSYHCQDATERAKTIVAKFGSTATALDESEKPLCVTSASPRGIPQPAKMQPNGKVQVSRTGLISYGETEIDLTAVEQVVSTSQTNAISNILQKVAATSEATSLRDALQSIDEEMDNKGLNTLAPGQFHGGLTRPRMIEAGAAINRLRLHTISQIKN